MLIEMRNAMLTGRGGKLSARSYIQDGLVAMWDGIENAGWGVHDPNATVWKNLAGNSDYDVTLTTNAKFVDEAMEVVAYGVSAQGSVALPYNNNAYHYEIVCSYDSTISDMVVMIFTGGGRNTAGYLNNSLILFAISDYSRKGFVFGSPATLYRADTDYTFSGIHQGSGTHDFSTYDGKVLSDITFTNTNISRITRENITFSFDTGASSNPPNGFRVHALRIYQSRLAEADRLANYAVDKARFNLPDAN